MILDDESLGRFAVGGASATGVFLAVSTAMWIFLFDRRGHDEKEALLQVKATARALYRFLLINKNQTGNYLETLRSFRQFADIISAISNSFSVEAIPGFISWRAATAEILQVVSKFVDELDQVARGTLPQTVLDTEQHEFHTELVDLMFQVDLSIQELDWATGIRRKGKKIVESLLGIFVLLLVASLAIALAANIEFGMGIDDDINVYWGALLVIGSICMLFYLVKAFNINKKSRSQWIEELVQVG